MDCFTDSALYKRSCAKTSFNEHVLTLQTFQANTAYTLIMSFWSTFILKGKWCPTVLMNNHKTVWLCNWILISAGATCLPGWHLISAKGIHQLRDSRRTITLGLWPNLGCCYFPPNSTEQSQKKKNNIGIWQKYNQLMEADYGALGKLFFSFFSSL